MQPVPSMGGSNLAVNTKGDQPMYATVDVEFENPTCVVSWDARGRFVSAEWKDFPTGNTYRAGLAAVLTSVRCHQATKFLSDTIRGDVVSLEDQAWPMEHWMPLARAAGLKHTAIVLPESVALTMSVEQILSGSASQEIKNAYFTNLESAKRWLASR